MSYTETLPTASHALSLALSHEPVPTTIAGQSQTDEGKLGQYQGYDNVHWYVGNAKQAATYFVTRMGFRRVAYRGLETGSKAVASHVVRNGDVTFVFTSPMYAPDSATSGCSAEDKQLLDEIHEHLKQHGDAVRDVAFEVDDVNAVYDSAVANGAHPVYPPKELTDEFGTAKYARIRTYGDTTHTLIERSNYSGVFLPGFRAVDGKDKTAKYLPPVNLMHIDHCVGNQDWDQMEDACA
jgi:4-hydroxyphenylpyruvate dioxygenase